jgi:hypothetical protein
MSTYFSFYFIMLCRDIFSKSAFHVRSNTLRLQGRSSSLKNVPHAIERRFRAAVDCKNHMDRAEQLMDQKERFGADGILGKPSVTLNQIAQGWGTYAAEPVRLNWGGENCSATRPKMLLAWVDPRLSPIWGD